MRLFGHPVHAMLVALPLGLLLLVPLWDALAIWDVLPEAASIAHYSELAGLVAGLLAALFGIADLVRHAGSPELLTTGLRHAFLAVLAISVFALAFALRERTAPPSLGIFALDALGAACLAAAGWFGAHLVFHYGVEVDAVSNPKRSGSVD